MTALTQGEIYAAYREKVLSYLSGKMESPEDAEDLCEEVFEQVCRSLPRFEEKSSLSTWIYRITRYTLIDYYRTKRTAEPLTEELAAPDDLEEDFIRRETLERLAFALKALQPEERDIIVLRYYRGKTLTEISRLTGISYGMVKVKHKKRWRPCVPSLCKEPSGFYVGKQFRFEIKTKAQSLKGVNTMKNRKKQIEKMAQEAVKKASEAVKSANDALTEAQTALRVMEELSDDDLDQVAGGGNPFGENPPYVPPQPIDDKDRPDM